MLRAPPLQRRCSGAGGCGGCGGCCLLGSALGCTAGHLGAAHLPCPAGTVLGCQLPPPGPGTGTPQTSGSSIVSGSRGSVPMLPAVRPRTWEQGIPWDGPMGLSRGSTPNTRIWHDPGKADVLWHMWLLTITRRALAPGQSPCVWVHEPRRSAGRRVLCQRPIYPGQCRLRRGCSQRDHAHHKARVKSKPHLSCLLSWIKALSN